MDKSWACHERARRAAPICSSHPQVAVPIHDSGRDPGRAASVPPVSRRFPLRETRAFCGVDNMVDRAEPWAPGIWSIDLREITASHDTGLEQDLKGSEPVSAPTTAPRTANMRSNGAIRTFGFAS